MPAEQLLFITPSSLNNIVYFLNTYNYVKNISMMGKDDVIFCLIDTFLYEKPTENFICNEIMLV